MAILGDTDIRELHAAVLSASLVQSRDALMAGVDGRLVAGMPRAGSALAQLLVDLHALNEAGQLTDTTVPLRTWLSNAKLLAGPRVEAGVFERAIERVDAVTRGLASVGARSARAIATPLEHRHILLVCANPRGTSPLRLAREERALRQSIQLAPHRDRLDVEALHAATIDDLRRALAAKARHIVHFAGHGETDGLRFEDEGGRSFVPDSGALGALLRRRGVETVVLNACYSLAIIQATPMGTRYTVGMDGPLDDAGAIEFARGFYDGIGAGQSVEDAYEEGLSCAGLKGVAVKAVLVKA